MSLSYRHTLIPDQVDYIPHPRQVADFFSVLIELGAAPRQAELVLVTEKEPRRRAGLPAARRERRHANLSGQPFVIVGPYMTAIDSVSSIGPALERLDEYVLRMSGIGPLQPLFQFDAKLYPQDQSYKFEVLSCLRPDVVSMSDYHWDYLYLREVATIPEAETVVPFS